MPKKIHARFIILISPVGVVAETKTSTTVLTGEVVLKVKCGLSMSRTLARGKGYATATANGGHHHRTYTYPPYPPLHGWHCQRARTQ